MADHLPPYIVTLSSIPPRFGQLAPVLRSYLAQSVPPARVILYLPQRYRRFPDYDGSLPDLPEGVELRRPEIDDGPATKVLGAVRELGLDSRADILFGDDDLIYTPDWAARLLAARRHLPDAAICAHGLQLEDLGFDVVSARPTPRAQPQANWRDTGYRWRKLRRQIALRKMRLERHEKPFRRRVARSGHADIFEGFAGVLVQPRFFAPEVFDIPDILWTVDDVWLSGMVAKTGTPIWVEADCTRFEYTAARHTDALNASTIDGAGRDAANRLCVTHFRDRHAIWL